MQTTIMTLQADEDAKAAPAEPDGVDFEAPVRDDRQRAEAPAADPDHSEYIRLLESSTHEVHRFVAKRIANKSDAEDIAQQVLLQAIENISTFRGKNFRAWLITICRHLIIDYYRARSRVQFVEVVEIALRETEPLLCTGQDTVPALCDFRARLGHWVDCITQRLRVEEQVAVLLADVHGYSDKASAEKLAMTIPSFKLLLHEARVRLNEISAGACVLLNGPAAREEHQPHPTCPPKNPSRKECPCPPVRTCDHSGLGQEANPGTRPSGDDGPAPCHCSLGSPRIGQGGSRCCVGCFSCLSRKCSFGVNCRLGIRCCRQIPRLLALRTSLLDALVFS